MDNIDPQVFSRQVLERALEAHGMSEGYLSPKDPLTLATIRDIATELDVPEDFVEKALAKAIVTLPRWKNGYRVIVDRYMPASPDIVLMEAKPILREHNGLMVLSPLEDGYIFTNIDDGMYDQSPQRLGEYGDVTLSVIPLDETGSIARMMVQVENPFSMMVAAVLGYGCIATILSAFVAAAYNWDPAFIHSPALIVVPIALVAGIIHAVYDWNKRSERIALQVTGAMSVIVDGVNQQVHHIEKHPETVAEQAGGFVARFLNGFRRVKDKQE